MNTTPQTDDLVKFIMDQLKEDSPTLMSDHPYYVLDQMAGLCRKLENDLCRLDESNQDKKEIINLLNDQCAKLENDVYRLIELNQEKAEIIDSLNNKCAEWEEKAATWLASPEAAKRFEGYRELAEMAARAEAQRDELLEVLSALVLNIDAGAAPKVRAMHGARAAIARVTGGDE